MNKKLLAVAVASAVAAPMAVNAESSLTVYGGVGVAVESIDNGVNDALAVNNNHSALGFEGSTDVNSDLAAVFHWDAFVNIDNAGGGGSLIGGGRDGWAGLRGAFGTVALGFQARPWKTLSHALDPFEGTIADYSSIMGNSGNGGEYFDAGIGNAIIWFGPNINGFTWHAQYGTEDRAEVLATGPGAGLLGFDANGDPITQGEGGNNFGLQANWSNEQFFIGASYDENENTAPVGDDTTVVKIVGSVNFGAATVTGAFETMEGIGFASNNAERDAFWLAGTYNFGVGSVRAAYSAADDVDGISDSGADQFSIGYFGNLTDNATWYAIYSTISNDNNANYGFTSAPHTSSLDPSLQGAEGQDSDAVSLGIKYNFAADLI